MPAFKVMTWNVENLFRPDAGADAAAKTVYDQKLALLAQVINTQAPDVIALQEVGGVEPIMDLKAALGGAYPHSRVSSFPDGRGIRVAFVSKLPIEESSDFASFPPGPATDIKRYVSTGETEPVTHMGRGALRIRVAAGNTTIDLVTVHLKSKLLSYPRPWGSSFQPKDENERAQTAGVALARRSAEAVTVRTWANAFLTGNDVSPLIVLGDMNDVPEAQTSLIMNGPSGSEIGTRGFDMADKGDDVRLFNLANAIADPARRYSRIQSGRQELLDQIFVSEELLPRDANDDRTVPHVDCLVDFDRALATVTEDPNERKDKVAPDHAPVVAAFQVA